MSLRIALALLAAMLLSGLGVTSVLPAPVAAQEEYDWCYEFNFLTNDYEMLIAEGEWESGLGIAPLHNGDTYGLTVIYTHPATVAPQQALVTFKRSDFATNNINAAATAAVFGLTHTPSPVNFTFSTEETFKTLPLAATSADQSGTQFGVSLDSSNVVYLQALQVWGNGVNPFPFNSCGPPTPTPVPATATPTATPDCVVPTATPTLTPTPTFTPTAGASPTPGPGTIVFDFTTSSHGFSFFANGGFGNATYVPGQGWQGGPPTNGTGGTVVTITRSFGVTFSFYRVEYDFYTSSASAGTGFHQFGTGSQINDTFAISGASGERTAGYTNGGSLDRPLNFVNAMIGGYPTGTTIILRAIRYYTNASIPFTPTPTPAPTSLPTATPIPGCEPTATPTFTATPYTLTPTPSNTPTPSLTPTPYTLTPTATTPPTQTPWIIVIPTQPPSSTPNPTVPAPASHTPAPTAIPPTSTGTPGTPVATGTAIFGGPSSGLGPLIPGFPDIEAGGDLLSYGESIADAALNIGRRATGWLNQAVGVFGEMASAWTNAAPTNMPGTPRCASEPLASQVCAIWFLLANTFFTGTVGALIIPLAVIVVDLWILFLFIRVVMALAERIKEIFGAS